jgi:hypothetical protein
MPKIKRVYFVSAGEHERIVGQLREELRLWREAAAASADIAVETQRQVVDAQSRADDIDSFIVRTRKWRRQLYRHKHMAMAACSVPSCRRLVFRRYDDMGPHRLCQVCEDYNRERFAQVALAIASAVDDDTSPAETPGGETAPFPPTDVTLTGEEPELK